MENFNHNLILKLSEILLSSHGKVLKILIEKAILRDIDAPNLRSDSQDGF